MDISPPGILINVMDSLCCLHILFNFKFKSRVKLFEIFLTVIKTLLAAMSIFGETVGFIYKD